MLLVYFVFSLLHCAATARGLLLGFCQPEKPNQEEASSSSDIKLAPDSRILNEVDRKKREQIEREKKKKEEEAKRKQEAEAKAKKEAEAAKAKKEPTRRRGTM